MFCKLLEKYWIVFKIVSKEPNILAAAIGSLLWDSCLEAQNSKAELKREFIKVQRKMQRKYIYEI